MKHLELFGVRSFQGQKVYEVVRYELSTSQSGARRLLGKIETYLSILSSGLPFFRYRSAFVRLLFRITASWRSSPITRFFSLTSFSKGSALSSSFRLVSSARADSEACCWTSWSCFCKLPICACEFSTRSRSSLRRANKRFLVPAFAA